MENGNKKQDAYLFLIQGAPLSGFSHAQSWAETGNGIHRRPSRQHPVKENHMKFLSPLFDAAP